MMRSCLRWLALSGILAVTACNVNVGKDGELSIDVAKGVAIDEWTRTYRIAPGGSLEIVNGTGTIVLTAATGDTVSVTATRNARSGSDELAREMLAKSAMVEDVSANRVRVEAKPGPRPEGVLGLESRMRVDYQIAIPRGIATQIRNQNGTVQIEHVEAAITAEMTNGQVVGRGITGALKATTVNGGIHLELASVTADIDATTVNGHVRLELPRDVNAALEARAVNGGVAITSDLPLAPSERSRTRISGRLNKGGSRISAQTTNGGVWISTPGGRFDPEVPEPPRPPARP